MTLFSGHVIDSLALLCLLISAVLLTILIVIDFRERLLPNKYVFPYAALGILFHILTDFSYLSLNAVLLGGALGYGLLWLVRAIGSWHYKQEALGLGDVKLMGAAGLWLGPENVMLALSLGAMLSIFHGIIYAIYTKKSLRRLEIPAGPGLIGGIFIMTIYMIFGNLFEMLV